MNRAHGNVRDQCKLDLIHPLSAALLANAPSESLGCRFSGIYLHDRADDSQSCGYWAQYAR
jgi:hypothetical protein